MEEVKLSKQRITLITIIGIILLGLILIIKKPSDKKYVKLEKDFKDLVTQYFERDIKGMVIGPVNHKVELSMLERSKFDITKMKDPKTNKPCNKKSYAIVNVNNPEETNKGEIKYEITNYLTCGKYKTEN